MKISVLSKQHVLTGRFIVLPQAFANDRQLRGYF